MRSQNGILAARARPSRAPPASLTLPLVLAVFFLSGFSSLVYQVVWVKRLTHVFGVTTYAVSAVLGAFFCGLALGSYLGGRVADRRRDGLRLYGWLEIGIGLIALALPTLFDALTPVYRALYPALKDSLSVLSLARAGLSFLLLVAPTTLMGATLPLLVRVLVAGRAELGRRVAALYAWNTLGAVAGSLASAYIFVGLFGLWGTLLIAAAFNGIVGLVALRLSKEASAHVPSGADARTDDVSQVGIANPAVARATLAAMFFSGFAALGYEVIWTRVLAVISDHSVYAFSAMVATVLIGIALGSEAVGRLSAQVRDPLRGLIAAELGLGLSALLSLPLIVWLARLVPPVDTTLGPARLNGNPLIFFLLALAALLLPSLCMGVTFPLATQVYARSLARVGRSVGETYAANVLGATLGSMATGFVLVPLLGAQRSLLALAMVNLLAAGGLALADARRRAVRTSGALAAALVVGLVLGPDALYPALFASLYPAARIRHNFEGVEATVTVTEYQGAHFIFLNGVHQAGTRPRTLGIHRLIGHLPALVRPEPERALIVGLGGGATSGAVAQHVGERLDIVELSAGMVAAARTFAAHNGAVLDDPRVRLVVDDGRNFLLLADGQYDLITADIIPPLHAHSSNLYSLEYYQSIAAHLNAGGLVSQWLDRSLLEHEQRILMRTFAAAFPHVVYWQHDEYGLLLGSNAPIPLDAEEIARGFTPAVARDLALLNIFSPADLTAGFRLADDDLRREIGPGLVLTDDHPYNEYFRMLRVGEVWRWLERWATLGS